MPQPIFHLYLTSRPAVIDAVGELEGESRNAFLHGAIAPDVGFFPGGDYHLSWLTHHRRTAEMCRALLRGAGNERERAFAFGWLTHVLADVLLHPTINDWCRPQLNPHDPRDALLRLHVQLELGMDVLHVAKVKREGVPTFESTFDDSTITFLTRAYQQVYNSAPDVAAMVQQQKNLARLTGQLLELELIMAGAAGAGLAAVPQKVLLQTLRAVAAVSSGARSIVTAFLNPVYPDLDLGVTLRDRLVTFDRWFTHHVATELHDLPNLDLDTGQPISTDAGSAVA